MPQTSLIREKPSENVQNIRHDQLFKELIHTFFKEFLQAFFPVVYDSIDFDSIKPLLEEVHTDLIEGETRRLDIVVETKLKGSNSIIIVHIEPQSTKQTHFHERMYQYFSLLYHKYRKPIIPIAVFSYKDNWERNQYTMGFPFFQVLTFNYLTLHLSNKHWQDYLESNNPAAAALLSKMGYTDEEKIQVKKEFLRMMVKMELNPAKQRLIYGFFETYLKLSEEEEGKLMDEIRQLDEVEAEKVMEIPISYEEKGIKKGIEKGIEKGRELEKEGVALEMLRKGLELELIVDVTKLERKQIEELKKQL